MSHRTPPKSRPFESGWESPRSTACPATPAKATADAKPRPRWLDPALAAAVTLAAHAIYLAVAARRDPFYAWTLPGFDQHLYQQQARAILQGDWLLRSAGVFYYSPLYAYFSALIQAIAGAGNFTAAHAAQAVVAAVASALTFDLARTWLGRPATWLATLAVALAPASLFYGQALLHESLIMLATTAALWGLRTAEIGRPRAPARLALAGAAGALAFIGRANAAAWVVAGGIWLIWGARGSLGWRAARRNVGVYALGIAVILAPLLLRNHAVAGRWTLGMSNGPALFYIGNNAQASGRFEMTAAGDRLAARAAAEGPGVWWRAWLEELRAEPARVLRNLPVKAYRLAAAADIPDNLNLHLGARLLWPLRVSPVRWEWLAPLGLVGLTLAAAGARRREWRLILGFAGVFALSLILIIPVGRYRLPLLLPLGIGAGFACEQAVVAWRARRRFPLAYGAAAFALLALALWPWQPGALIRPSDYVAATRAAAQQQRWPMAARLAREGLARWPSSPLLAREAFLAARDSEDEALSALAAEHLWRSRRWQFDDGLRLAEYYAPSDAGRARVILQALRDAKPQDPRPAAMLQRLP